MSRHNWGNEWGGRGSGFFSQKMAPGVKYLLIFTVLVYVGQIFAAKYQILDPLVFALVPQYILSGKLWQLITATFVYSFTKDPISELVSVLLALFLIYSTGNSLEAMLGTKRFLRFFIGGGTVSHVLAFILVALLGNIHYPRPISSGYAVVFGSLIGCLGTLFWNTANVSFFFVPMRGKVIVWFCAAICLFLMLKGELLATGPLCGLLVGFLFVRKSQFQLYRKLEADFKERLRLWRIKRKYRKFRVVDSEMKELWDDLEERLNQKDRNKYIN